MVVSAITVDFLMSALAHAILTSIAVDVNTNAFVGAMTAFEFVIPK